VLITQVFSDWNQTAGRKKLLQVIALEAIAVIKGSKITLRCQGYQRAIFSDLIW
jgi:hypothetical protein